MGILETMIDIPAEHEKNVFGQFDIFAKKIDRDPGIVLGRLLNDGKVAYNDWTLTSLRHKYRVKTS